MDGANSTDFEVGWNPDLFVSACSRKHTIGRYTVCGSKEMYTVQSGWTIIHATRGCNFSELDAVRCAGASLRDRCSENHSDTKMPQCITHTGGLQATTSTVQCEANRLVLLTTAED